MCVHTYILDVAIMFVGKTLLAKAVANQTSATFLRVCGSELIQKYLVSSIASWNYGGLLCNDLLFTYSMHINVYCIYMYIA